MSPRTRSSRLVAGLATAALAVTAVTGSVVGESADASSPVPHASARLHHAAGISFASAHELRGDFGSASGSPRAWAARTLAAQAPRLHVDATSFRWELVRRSLAVTSVRGREYRGGLPIQGTDVLVSAYGGRVHQVDAQGSLLRGGATSSPVGAALARTVAKTRLDITSLFVAPHVDRVLAPWHGRLVDTYQVSLVGKVPARAARVDVAAATGRVLRVVDSADYDRAPAAQKAKTTKLKARVYDPNPVVTSRNTKLRSPFETSTGVDVPLDSPELTKELKVRTMEDLDPAQLQLGLLSGTWANIEGVGGYLNVRKGIVKYSRSDPKFVGLMAYEHVDRYQRWLHSIGFKHVNAEQQDLIPTLAEGYDNSMYMPAEDVIVYGGGGVPDAEDAEVILHEYGHAIQDDQVPGYGATAEGGAMGEGFGDFNGANYYSLTSGGFGDLCDSDWDSTSYSTTNPPCLRRLDSTKKYPKDIEGEVHADGELWSAYLWRLRSHLGKTTKQKVVNSITLVLTMHELLTPNANFANAVAGLRTAAKALKHPEWAKFVDSEAKKTGFKLNP